MKELKTRSSKAACLHWDLTTRMTKCNIVLSRGFKKQMIDRFANSGLLSLRIQNDEEIISRPEP